MVCGWWGGGMVEPLGTVGTIPPYHYLPGEGEQPTKSGHVAVILGETTTSCQYGMVMGEIERGAHSCIRRLL